MDGTLLNENDEITNENREAIEKAREKGIKVIISTGRSLITSREFAESLNLTSFLITVNGSEIWEDQGKLLERHLMQSDVIQWMWELSKSYKTEYWATSTDKVWRNQMPDHIEKHQWLKFGYTIEDDPVREIILKELSKHNLEISNSSPKNIEINAAGITKARAVSRVCERLNIPMEQVMAIGDSLNDIGMIKKVGLGIAMGNAQEIVKESADWVTLSNKKSGVAEAIKRWAL